MDSAKIESLDPAEELKKYERELDTPLGPISLCFRNNSMLSVKLSRSEPFFKQVEKCWNTCHTEKRDPHEPLQKVVEHGRCMSEEDKKEFVSQFLFLAADATRELQAGQESACASLEHHAEQTRP